MSTENERPASPSREGWLTARNIEDTLKNAEADGSTPYFALEKQYAAALCRMALSALEQPTGWMPIASAPKDKVILAWDEDNGIRKVWWYKTSSLGSAGWSTPHLDKYVHPTHWQPLPLPPVADLCPHGCVDGLLWVQLPRESNPLGVRKDCPHCKPVADGGKR